MQEIDFDEIPINREEISQSKLNIENKTRSNLFNWNGQFSPQFIEALLNKYAKDGMVIVDPFLGSGTVLAESARKGLEAYGTELNASAYYMAKTYEISNLSIEDREKIIAYVDSKISKIEKDESIIDELTKMVNETKYDSIYNIVSTLIIVMDIFKRYIGHILSQLNNEELIEESVLEVGYF